MRNIVLVIEFVNAVVSPVVGQFEMGQKSVRERWDEVRNQAVD